MTLLLLILLLILLGGYGVWGGNVAFSSAMNGPGGVAYLVLIVLLVVLFLRAT